jgi:hypothetical protein
MQNTMNDLRSHWQFAFGQAVSGLRELVCSFDFAKLADRHTYVGIRPDYLVEVIDGFLGESFISQFGGSRTELENIRQILVKKIIPAFESGLESGKSRWKTGNRVYGEIDTKQLHDLASQLGPADAALNGWFAEGFCFAYSYAELESMRPST